MFEFRGPAAAITLAALGWTILPPGAALAQWGANPPSVAVPAAAPTPRVPPAAPALACGYPLESTVYGAWQAVGGQDGRLGCATSAEVASSPSPQGSAAKVATFGLNGEIVLHASGPRTGQAFPVVGCFYRLYVQYGGTSGWLGLPISEAENTPDGSKQAFEGGVARYLRAPDTCDASPTSESAPASTVAVADLVPLDVFENPNTGERISLASGASIRIAESEGFQRLRPQARVMTDAQPGAVRLKLYEDEQTANHMMVATSLSEREALDRGLAFEAGQGFIWTAPHPGTIALKLYRDPANGHTALTAGQQDESDAAAKGLAFVRIEGYAPPAE